MKWNQTLVTAKPTYVNYQTQCLSDIGRIPISNLHLLKTGTGLLAEDSTEKKSWENFYLYHLLLTISYNLNNKIIIK
jgi:hypothetical protein